MKQYFDWQVKNKTIRAFTVKWWCFTLFIASPIIALIYFALALFAEVIK